jgi:alpha-L-fucosidase
MRLSRRSCLALAGGLLGQVSARAQDAAAINKDLAERKPLLTHTTHPEAQWFAEAGLGLFVHWGLASVHGNIDLSWGMIHGMGGGEKITPEEYFRLAERFQPGKWDPDRMLEAAKRAGFRYAVLTAKHHEGFALWPSAHGEFNTGKHAGGRDLVRPFIEACRKHGLKAGLYYSPGDWYYSRRYMSFNYRSAHCWQNTGLACRPEVPDNDTRFQPVTLPERTPEWDRAYRDYQRGQIRELLTRYGKLDVLWFDMARPGIITPEEIRALQPAIVINNRMGGGTGDFLTPEGAFPKERPAGWWELCTIWNSPYWGYVTRNDERYAPLGSILSTLAKARAWGGNVLFNVGPRPDGTMPQPYYDGTEQLAGWMRHSGESLFGIEPGGWPESSDVPVTVNGKTQYVHLLPGAKQARMKAAAAPASATLLRTGEKVPFSVRDGVLAVELPAAMQTDLVDTVAVRFGT